MDRRKPDGPVWSRSRYIGDNAENMALDLGALFASRMSELQNCDLDAVRRMPDFKTDRYGKVSVTVYHDVLESGEHMVVVQLVQEFWFGIHKAVTVDGFVVAADGTKRRLTERETWPFT